MDLQEKLNKRWSKRSKKAKKCEWGHGDVQLKDEKILEKMRKEERKRHEKI